LQTPIEMTNPPPSASSEPRLLERLFALLLYILPHHFLSRGMHWLTRNQWPPLKRLLINSALRVYRIDLTTAKNSDPESYPSFNAFFTRPLAADARPVAAGEDAVASPVDGKVSQAGPIQDGRIFQAKGQEYSLLELLGGDRDACALFENGSFATLYLSPRDYHRIHMPLDGELRSMTHIPGRLFSVSPATTRVVPRLFSRNERIVNLFDTAAGPMAVIMVGAIFVASMDTVWAGTVAPAFRRITRWDYGNTPTNPIRLEKGAELGRFNMGSTVILLFGQDAVHWSNDLRPDASVQMGMQIGGLTQTQAP